MKTYTCPFCNEEQTEVIEWNICSIGYRQNITSKEFGGEQINSDQSDFECYTCPNCGEDLPEDVIKTLNL